MPEKILVTGSTGFLGSHIVNILLQEGYFVRAASRSAKIPRLLEVYADSIANGRLEVVRIMDLANEQFPQLFQGIDAVIHTAAPQVGRQTAEVALRNTFDGTLNILRQAEEAGIKRVVITSAAVTATGPTGNLSDQEWNTTSWEVALTSRNPMTVFIAGKTLTEKAVWAFADTHPHVDITTINPPMMFGPLSATHKPPVADFAELSTNVLVYRLLFPNGTYPTSADYIDVRDVARAHIFALKSPPSFIVGRKRVLIASPNPLHFQRIVEYLRENRPALRPRLTKLPAPQYEREQLPVDFERIADVLGMKKGDFKRAEDTFVDSVDRLLAMEAGWIQRGYRIEDCM